MKDRLPALDGLRGFAAMSVVLGHASIWNLAGNLPILPTILIALSADHNAVQILFVLSGFLMAFLYPVISNPLHFIKKRYARIFPIYTTIVIYIWILNFGISAWYLQLAILVGLALLIHFLWTMLHRYFHHKHIDSILFFSFVFLQITVVLFNTLFSERYIVTNRIAISNFLHNLLIMITNLTLTTQLVRGIPATNGVFWSLGAEVLFYIVYPFIVFPLVRLAKNSGVIVSILIIIAVSKILLDLDKTIISIATLNGINIARANGFVAGVTVGTIYQSRGKVWNSIHKVISHPLFGGFAFLLLILAQLGEHIVGLGSISFMNIFYLVTSWLIAIVVLNAIIPHSLTYKIFSVKILTFLGLISYSLYLVHTQLSPWQNNLLHLLLPVMRSQRLAQVTTIIVYVFVSVGVSYFLFRTVEFLYFASKKKVIATTQAAYKEKVVETKEGYSSKGYTVIIIVAVLALSLLYTQMYSSKLLLERHAFQSPQFVKDTEVSLLDNPVDIPFISHTDNLSVIGFDLQYVGSAGLTRITIKNPAILQFELLDSQHKHIFSSQIHAFEVEGSPRFQFGFPTIANSKNKEYFVKLSILNGGKNDSVRLITSPTSFISISTLDKKTLLHNPLLLFSNRLVFIFTNPDYLFLISFIILLSLLALRNSIFRKARVIFSVIPTH